jgi:hypothetical protein
MSWHPRGEPTWPDWRSAAPGTRVEHVRSGARATFVKPSRNRNNGAIVRWDGLDRNSTVVAPAFDLRPIP